jgi:hypothetical protein
VFKPNKIKRFKINHRQAFDAITVAAIVFGLLALLALIYYQARPLKLADIKVPVATDKATYYPSQEVSGIFFGETYYKGDVKILREVFCSNYRGVISPPKESADGEFFSTQARERKLEGATVFIGTLPANVPIGSNCVIQFTNVYDIQTPFGVRHETVQYYTQNFSIVSKEERQQRDETNQQQNQLQQQELQKSGSTSYVGGGDDNSNQNNTTTNNTTNNNAVPPSNQKPSEPVQPPQSCTVNLLGIKLFCR